MASRSLSGGGAASPRWGVLHRHPRLRLGLLLGPPMLWLGVLYLGSLAALFITSLWTVDAFGGNIERVWNLDNYRDLFTIDVYRTITVRTLLIAVAVTVIDALLAFPIALYMAKVASPRLQRALVIAVLTPLWASYLVKAYAWRGMFATGGPLDDLGLSPGYGLVATVVTLSYLWLPYMILPMYAGLERLPNSLIEASADLGATTRTTMRRVVLPVLLPAAVAGLDLHLLADPRRLHRGQDRRRGQPDARQRRLRLVPHRQQPAVRGGRRDHPGGDDAGLPGGGAPDRGAGLAMSARGGR